MRAKTDKHIVTKFDCTSQYLSDFSPQDKPWDVHKANNDKVSEMYQELEDGKRALRLNKCSDFLEFAFGQTEAEKHKIKLKFSRFCHVRTCPVCQWRRSLTWRARLHKAMPKIFEGRRNYNLIFLTLTIKNCEVNELRNTISLLNKSWAKLVKYKKFPGKGWIKSIEVTRPSDTHAHPHLHCIVLVSSSYFSGKLIQSHAAWVKHWRKALGVDYDPSVRVKKVKLKGKPREKITKKLGRPPTHVEALACALVEVFKYSVKESDLTASATWLQAITKQLHHTRAIALGGLFKEHMSEQEPEDLLNLEEQDLEEIKEEARILFGWDKNDKRYRSL